MLRVQPKAQGCDDRHFSGTRCGSFHRRASKCAGNENRRAMLRPPVFDLTLGYAEPLTISYRTNPAALIVVAEMAKDVLPGAVRRTAGN
jgi:hypothetical protein